MKRGCAVIVVGLGLAALAYARVPWAGNTVIENAIIAQQRMEQIYRALQIYRNDSGGLPPDSPVRLFELGLITDPAVFWHPGDSDGPPTTIDNNIPNAPNSAQISFQFDLLVIDDESTGDIVIRDNSIANNNGLFVQYLTDEGTVDTDPVNSMPVPTSSETTKIRLNSLWRACLIYANDFESHYPPRFSMLHPEYVSARTFWNPGDMDAPPADIANDIPNAPNSAQISFNYFGANRFEDDFPPDSILVADNSPTNNGGYGLHVLFGSGRVGFLLTAPLADWDTDGDIDLADWAQFQQCSTATHPYGILDHHCRVFDWDGNNKVEPADNREFTAAMSGPR